VALDIEFSRLLEENDANGLPNASILDSFAKEYGAALQDIEKAKASRASRNNNLDLSIKYIFTESNKALNSFKASASTAIFDFRQGIKGIIKQL